MALPAGTDLSALEILEYPDVRLRGPFRNVLEFDGDLEALVRRMFQVMYAARGVGLAAPQVGVPLRLFVISPTGQPPGDQPDGDELVCANPRIVQAEGDALDDEGCLSFPGLTCKIRRRKRVVVEARDLGGRVFRQEAQDLLARIFQHELDHIDGVLLVDRMSTVARLANRHLLKELEDRHAQRPPTP